MLSRNRIPRVCVPIAVAFRVVININFLAVLAGHCFSATLYKNVPLKRVLSAEALITPATWKWLDCEMYAFVSLQIVVSVKALGTLIALERSIVVRKLRGTEHCTRVFHPP